MSDQAVLLRYEELTQQRLDRYLVSRFPDLSRSRLQKLIQDGYVFVNGKMAEKSGQDLEFGATIQIQFPPIQPSELIPQEIKLDILFENKDVLVVNKPAGMVVHPAAGHAQDTLVNAVLGYDPNLGGVGGERRPGIVHRLDKDTSGIILIAKNDHAHHWLSAQFKDRKVIKQYLALVDGHPPTPQGRIEAPIGRDLQNRQKMAVVALEKGREAVTEYRSIERFSQYELLEVHPITGRTHQIRVHMAFLGCPVAGDTLYGHRHSSLAISRFFLHSYHLSICLPGEKKARLFEAPLPAELETQLSKLRRQ